jgi:hypothetical protein
VVARGRRDCAGTGAEDTCGRHVAEGYALADRLG